MDEKFLRRWKTALLVRVFPPSALARVFLPRVFLPRASSYTPSFSHSSSLPTRSPVATRPQTQSRAVSFPLLAEGNGASASVVTFEHWIEDIAMLFLGNGFKVIPEHRKYGDQGRSLNLVHTARLPTARPRARRDRTGGRFLHRPFGAQPMPRLRFPPWHKIARDCNAGGAPQAGEPQPDTVGGACAGAGFIRPSSGLKPIKTPVAEGHGEPIREVRVMYPILAPVALAPPDGAHGVAGCRRA